MSWVCSVIPLKMFVIYITGIGVAEIVWRWIEASADGSLVLSEDSKSSLCFQIMQLVISFWMYVSCKSFWKLNRRYNIVNLFSGGGIFMGRAISSVMWLYWGWRLTEWDLVLRIYGHFGNPSRLMPVSGDDCFNGDNEVIHPWLDVWGSIVEGVRRGRFSCLPGEPPFLDPGCCVLVYSGSSQS